MRRSITAAAFVAAVVAVVIAGVAQAGVIRDRQVLHQFALLNAQCDGSGLNRPDAPLNHDWTVTFTAKHGMVSATIRAKAHAGFFPRNTLYSVRLIQGLADCHTGLVEFRLGNNGHGTVTLTEPIVSDFALVHIEITQSPCDSPLGLECYYDGNLVSETFRH
jgi:hypothetical protein